MPEHISAGLVFAAVVSFHALGLLTAVAALFHTRSSQGAVAWLMALLAFPYLTVPLYWIFGRNRFHGYVVARRAGDEAIHRIPEELDRDRGRYTPDPATLDPGLKVLEELARLPFTNKNRVTLLKDGEATFQAIFQAIQEAREYLLVQYFIIHDDHLGRRFQRLLMDKAEEGVRVYLLYDEIGSFSLPGRYLDELRAAGVRVSPFHTTKGRGNRLQINFRNHRKIVVADGRICLVGGHNVGDEYLGLNPGIGPWRDTTARFEGPSAILAQLTFAEDWYWASGGLPDVQWEVHPAPEGNQLVLVLPSGPADTFETCTMFFHSVISQARERIWIVSPYFVPNDEVAGALRLAALRGVDVRIMLPHKPDHKLVWLASFSYLEELEEAGVRFFPLPGRLPPPEGHPGGRPIGLGGHGQRGRSLLSAQLRNIHGGG